MKGINFHGDYEAWFAAADDLCYKKHGLSLYDLPDICYADMFEAGQTPLQAVKAAYSYARSEGY